MMLGIPPEVLPALGVIAGGAAVLLLSGILANLLTWAIPEMLHGRTCREKLPRLEKEMITKLIQAGAVLGVPAGCLVHLGLGEGLILSGLWLCLMAAAIRVTNGLDKTGDM